MVLALVRRSAARVERFTTACHSSNRCVDNAITLCKTLLNVFLTKADRSTEAEGGQETERFSNHYRLKASYDDSYWEKHKARSKAVQNPCQKKKTLVKQKKHTPRKKRQDIIKLAHRTSTAKPNMRRQNSKYGINRANL